MADESFQKIYLLGSKADGIESVIITDLETLSVSCFETFEDAKDSFAKAYNLLLAPSFTPSIPPSEEELEYHRELMRLIVFYPVIVELDRAKGPEILTEWRNEMQPVYQPAEKFYDGNYWHCPMRCGFFKEYGVLDIVTDIETTPFVGADGKMVLRINQIHYSSPKEQSKMPKPLSEEEINDILRKRGYL